MKLNSEADLAEVVVEVVLLEGANFKMVVMRTKLKDMEKMHMLDLEMVEVETVLE